MKVLVRGGGDLASGSIIRIRRAGWDVLVTELPEPMTVRRMVSFSQAVFDGGIVIENVTGLLVKTPEEAADAFAKGYVGVIVDPSAHSQNWFRPDVVIDARMRKKAADAIAGDYPLYIGLGPGFTAGRDCHCVIETNRGPKLGRVFWQGSAQADTGIPEQVGGYQAERVLRAPGDGVFTPKAKIGDILEAGSVVAEAGGVAILSPFPGVLRGLLQGGIPVKTGDKVGDVDPRMDPSLCWLVSDKALAVGGGVLEAILGWDAKKEGRL